MSNKDDILNFWFKGLNDEHKIDPGSPLVKWWFVKDEKIDSQIREQFEPDLLKARRGEYDDWGQTAAGRLALVLLFDQFSRNMYRNTAKMFETDPQALRLSLLTIGEKIDAELQLIERIFLYMPLMHAEDLATQKLSLRCFESLVHQSKEKCEQSTPYYDYSFNYAKKHYETIERFGRFPQRHSFLGKVSTPAEQQFLRERGASF